MSAKPNIQVTSDLFGGVEGIKSILNDYYEREIDKLDPDEQVKARRFIEEGLIVAKKRVHVSEGVEKEHYHIQPTLLKKLLDSRIIRREHTHLGRSYEVSHDTLVHPILESYKRRKEIKDKEAAEKVLAEERKRYQRLALLSVAGFALFLFALFQLYAAKQAESKALNAESKALAAESKALDAKKEVILLQLERDSLNYDFFIKSGKTEMENGNFEKAENHFTAAQRFTDQLQETDNLINQVRQLKSEQQDFKKIFEEADVAYNKGQVLKALNILMEAANHLPDKSSKALFNQRRKNYSVDLYQLFLGHVSRAAELSGDPDFCVWARGEASRAEPMLRHLKDFNTQQERRIIKQVKATCK